MTDYDDEAGDEYEIDDVEEFFEDMPEYEELGGAGITTTENTRLARREALNYEGRVAVRVITKGGTLVDMFKGGITSSYLKQDLNASGFSFKKYLQYRSGGEIRATQIQGYQVVRYDLDDYRA